MVILPINSVINPFLYDDALVNIIKAPILSLSTRVFNPAAILRFNQRVIPQHTGEIALDRNDTGVGNIDSPKERETGL